MRLFLKCRRKNSTGAEVFLPHRLVWLAGEGGDEMDDAGLDLEGETPGEAPDETEAGAEEGAEAADAAAAAVKAESSAKREELLRENENSGEAADYGNEFEKFSKKSAFDYFVATLKQSRDVAGINTVANPDMWLSSDPVEVADIFDGLPNLPPGWKGKAKFLEGLRAFSVIKEEHDAGTKATAEPAEAALKEAREKYDASREVLEKIVGLIRNHMKDEDQTEADTREQAEKGPLPPVLQNGVSNLLNNWHRATGKEKLVYAGAIGVGLMLLSHYKDSKFPILTNIWKAMTGKDFTFKDAGIWAVSLWTVNFLSGKASKDGRTLLERADFLRDADDLKEDNRVRAFAVEAGALGDNEKYRAILKLQNTDVKELYEEYIDARNRTGKKFIPPENLGFSAHDLKGEAIYSVAEEFIKSVGYNAGLNKRREENPNYPKELTKEDEEVYEGFDYAIDAFRKKYISRSQFGDQEVTLQQAIYYEFRTRDVQAIIRRGEAARLHQRAAKRGKEAASEGYDLASQKAAEARSVLSKTWNKTWSNYLVPAGLWTKGKFNKYLAAGRRTAKELAKKSDLIKRLNKHEQEEYFDKVFDDSNLAVTVTESGKLYGGSVTVMGVPEVPYERKTRPADGKEIIVIEKTEFVIEDGVSGNVTAAGVLEKAMREKVEKLFQKEATSKAPLNGLKPSWNTSKKQWEIEKMQFNAFADLNLGPDTKDVRIEVADDHESMRFFLGGTEIKDFNNLERTYTTSVVEELIAIKKTSRLTPFLYGLEYKIEPQVYDDPALAAHAPGRITKFIRGTIDGLEFHAVIDPSGPDIYFIEKDSTGTITKVGGFEVLKIDKNIGGEAFLDGLAANVQSDGKFMKPFFDLRNRMDQVSEGLGDRLALAFPTTRLWVIPTSLNVPAGVNGQVVQKAWNNMLEFKMYETLDLFQHELNGETVDKIDTVYDKIVQPVLNNLNDLWKLIDKEPDDEARAKRFDEFLSGETVPGTSIPGLDYMNYTNEDYRKLFKEFKQMIHSSDFNYAGFEDIADIGFSDDAHKSYGALYRVWSYLTRDYRVTAPPPPGTPNPWVSPPNKLSTNDQKTLRLYIDQIKQRLHEAQQRGGGKIAFDNLLPSDTEAEIKKWIDPSVLPPGTTSLNN